MNGTIFDLKKENFVLFRPGKKEAVPKIILGTYRATNPPGFTILVEKKMNLHKDFPDLWLLPVNSLDLEEEKVYHYFFEIANDNVHASEPGKRIWVTDPLAGSVDWRIKIDEKYNDGIQDPASVVTIKSGILVPCDPDGKVIDWKDDLKEVGNLPENQNLVIYELPTSWARVGFEDNGAEIDEGSFQDILALLDKKEIPMNFEGTAALEEGHEHLLELGINAIELLPPADSFIDREWGYATSNYFAPDFNLGYPKYYSYPEPLFALGKLIKTCHKKGIRFFSDMVTGFANQCPMRNINYLDFFIHEGTGDPEETGRHSWGGDLFKYNYKSSGYDPVTGETNDHYPARQFMKLFGMYWLFNYHIDGIRMDSIETIKNYDFIQEFKEKVRECWNERIKSLHLSDHERNARFLVVGEELGDPIPLISQNRLDSCWNEQFLYRVRSVIMGRQEGRDANFEDTVRKLIDCRNIGFTDGAQAINYITTHDTEGFSKERLYNYLKNNHIVIKEKRIKLAFVCLLTAVGIPMIFAGEEFADQHDREVVHPDKQKDPVNYDRLAEPWRQEVCNYVARIVKFRTASKALSVNDTDFIHFDFTPGRRVIAYRRGREHSDEQVVVVANFSDWGQMPGEEYVINNWPALPAGKEWKEISQDRRVPSEWAGRETIFPWEAKIYTPV